jgi:DNA-binding NarL/FixJ family response regulator
MTDIGGSGRLGPFRLAPLQVLLLTPDEVRCEPLVPLLAADERIEIVARTGRESEALALFFRFEPDVMVVDWRVAEREPARAIGMLRRVAPGACVVAVVPAAESMPARAAHALGASLVTTCAGLRAGLGRIDAARAVR